MKARGITAMTQRYTTDPHSFTVIELSTGTRTQCTSLAAMMATKSRLELEAAGLVVTTVKKQARLEQLEEAQQAGMARGGR